MFFRATNKKQRAYTYLSSVDVSIYCVQAVAVRSQRGVLWFCVSLCCFCFVLICRAQVVQFRFLFCFSKIKKWEKISNAQQQVLFLCPWLLCTHMCTCIYVQYICTAIQINLRLPLSPFKHVDIFVWTYLPEIHT